MDLTDSDKEALRVLANSDLRCSKYAQKLLIAFDIETMDTPNNQPKPQQPITEPSIEPKNEPKGSIFAY